MAESVSVNDLGIINAFHRKKSTPYSTLLLSILRLFLKTSVHDMPGVWNLVYGRRNKQAEMEGPFYVLGAPSRQISDGKGVIASPETLKSFVPLLMTIRILSPDGTPLANASLDWWQADSSGKYYFWEYDLRGTVNTDANGVVEVLTVVPGAYGIASNIRPGHIHLIIQPPREDASKYDELTTQLYVCKGNDTTITNTDILNRMRKFRGNLVLNVSSIPSASGGQRYMDFPELDAEDSKTTAKVESWNKRLSELGDVRVAATASIDLRLNAKSGWF